MLLLLIILLPVGKSSVVSKQSYYQKSGPALAHFHKNNHEDYKDVTKNQDGQYTIVTVHSLLTEIGPNNNKCYQYHQYYSNTAHCRNNGQCSSFTQAQ